MNVLFDASVIGLSRMDLNCRTGVLRYTENLVRGLLKHGDVPLSFSASEGFRPLLHLHSYQKEHSEFSGIPVIFNKRAAAVYNFFHAGHSNLDPYQGFIGKIQNRIAWEGMKFIENRLANLSKSQLKKFAIYHSPFWPIPEVIRKNRSIRKFLTIHDLYDLKMTPQMKRSNSFGQCLLDSVGNDDWVICVSEATKKDFLELKPGFNSDHALVSYESMSDSLAKVSERKRIEVLKSLSLADSKYFLSVGAIHERKNTAHLIRSFAEFVQGRKDKEVRLVLVGPPAESYLKQLGEMPELRALGDQVRFVGFKEDDELAALYQSAQGFLYPSLYEGFGIPILEAMRLGCPVIASNNSSIPEVAGEAALLVSPKEQGELIAAMASLLDHQELRQNLIKKGEKQVTKFTWDACTEKTVNAYLKALAERV